MPANPGSSAASGDRHEARRLIRSAPALLLGITSAILTVLSLLVVYQGANDEPYLAFRSSDVLTQVVLGSVLLFAWVVIALVIVWCIYRRLVSGRWIALIAWAGVVCLYLWESPSGYVSDLTAYMVSEDRRCP